MAETRGQRGREATAEGESTDSDSPPEPRDEEIPRETAPEIGDDGADEGAGGIAGSLRRSASLATAVARGSARGIARNSEAATRGGALLAERAGRIAYWPALLCILGAIVLQVALPGKLTPGPPWLLPSLEGALLIVLAITRMRSRIDEEHPARRRFAIALIALVNAANAVSLFLLAHELLHKHVSNGRSLILSGVAIWLTNVLIFALWYWMIDRGGPARRLRHPDPEAPIGRPDFVFPEMGDGKPYAPANWLPDFIDYVYLSLSTATALSPADTMPITGRAKTLMGIQGLISLVTLGLIISRAVNILS